MKKPNNSDKEKPFNEGLFSLYIYTQEETMKAGDTIRTLRFLTVIIDRALTREEAYQQGFTEPTHYWDDPDYEILGKHTAMNHMIFAAVKKEKESK